MQLVLQQLLVVTLMLPSNSGNFGISDLFTTECCSEEDGSDEEYQEIIIPDSKNIRNYCEEVRYRNNIIFDVPEAGSVPNRVIMLRGKELLNCFPHFIDEEMIDLLTDAENIFLHLIKSASYT